MACTPRGIIPTGFRALDTALGIGGLPRGSIVELFGPARIDRSCAFTLAAELNTEATSGSRTTATTGWFIRDSYVSSSTGMIRRAQATVNSKAELQKI